MVTKEQIQPFFKTIYNKSNLVVESLLIGYFLFGIALSFFYDTYLIAFGVGLLNLIFYFGSRLFFKETKLNQYVASLVAVIFMAQFIYQMHGLFEMHFTAFIAIIAIIAYQNKYAFLPAFIFVIIHHSFFAYTQYLGYTDLNEAYQQVYFTQLDYMDFQTFLFHTGLYALGITIAAIYAHNLETDTIRNAENIIKLEKSEETVFQNIAFANDIAKGQFNIKYNHTEGDQLGSALEEMRDNLKQSSEREAQEKFENVGVAEVVEIIRNNGENLENLSYEVISYLVKYLDVNQGGTFILMDENEDHWLELKGCYAYDRKKFMDKRIEIGQGLIGQCFREKEMIRLKEIPKDYVSITSGLGEATPTSLIILPIKNDQIIEGVIELAGFKDFEPFEINFLRKVCENMAATITSAKINTRTKILYEQSQQQAEEMRAQEEEMRQNMEELSATQEEMERKSKESENRLTAINLSGIGSIEFDINGNILRANDTFCNLMRYTKEELEGHHHRIFVDPEYAASDDYKEFWADLAKGKSQQGEYLRYDKIGKPIHLFGAYSVIRNENEEPSTVHKFVLDLTDRVNKMRELKIENNKLKKELTST